MAQTSPDILTRNLKLYGDPSLISTNPLTQILKTT